MYDRTTRRATVVALALSLLAGIGGCADADPIGPMGEGMAPGAALAPTGAASVSDLQRDLAALRGATALFHRFENGVAAGYDILVAHPETGVQCLEHPEIGGMGRHYLNLDLVNDEVEVTRPEVLIYEPERNGRLRLVGVEYLIPFTELGPEESPPELFGQAFVQNETFGVWALHVWHMKHNTAGMFADWNPAVSCEFDAAVDD